MGFKEESSRSFTLRRSQDWLERSREQGGRRSEKVSVRGGYGSSEVQGLVYCAL